MLYGQNSDLEHAPADVDGGLFLDRKKETPVEIWQIDDRFLIVQLRQGILLVEQSAAHERVLYERAVESLKGVGGFSQQLLFPKTLEFSPADFSLIQTLVPELRTLGFDVDLFWRAFCTVAWGSDGS
jgi:DNA mismatch repair protein MutL